MSDNEVIPKEEEKLKDVKPEEVVRRPKNPGIVTYWGVLSYKNHPNH